MQTAEGGGQIRMAGVLVCFALREEAAPFRRFAAAHPEIHILVTGVGRRNAERAIQAALARERPNFVLTCGYAGALDPTLTVGTVVFDVDENSGWKEKLLATGARPVRFHCNTRVAASAADKQALRQSTSAEAVEMESEAIRQLCREQQIPSATIRAISDAANEDLPLDFNRLLTSDQELNYGRLLAAVLWSPGTIPGLLRLRRQCRLAARNLARVLENLLPRLWR